MDRPVFLLRGAYRPVSLASFWQVVLAAEVYPAVLDFWAR